MSSLLVVGAAGCTGPPSEVVIETRVSGEPVVQPTLTRAWQGARALGQKWWAGDYLEASVSVAEASTQDAGAQPGAEPAAGPAKAKPDALSYVLEPATTPDAFAAQVRALREGPKDEVDMIARNIAVVGPRMWPEIAELLTAERKRPKREYKQVLALIGGDVPNRYGHFALHWKKAHGYDVRLSEDWFEDLLRLPSGRVSKLLRPVYRDAVLTTALLRAASNMGGGDSEVIDEIVGVLLDTAYVHEGTFRDEVGRAIDGLGDPAIAALLRASVPPDGAAEGSTAERRATYASFCLDRMDRLHPSRALEAVAADRSRLAEVVEAYASVRDGEAAPLLLELLDSEVPQVRSAARASFAAYVEGPLPKIRRKSIRLLNGQTSTQRAELSYREHARLAIRAQLAADAPELLEPECKLWLPGGVIDHECEGQPARLYGAYVDYLDHQRETEQHALLARALGHDDPLVGATMLDTLLTDPSVSLDPDLVAPFFTEVATLVEARGDDEHAARLLRKSAMILASTDPERADALTIDALLLESRSEALDTRGQRMLLSTARELDESEPRISAALAGLDARALAQTESERETLRTYLLMVFASLVGLCWLAGRLHSREAKPVESS